jgi:uncharacterized protein YlxW (UPF0749 family)
MKFRIVFILLTTLVLVYAARVSAQESSDAGQTIEALRAQLSSLQDHEADRKIRLEQLNFDLKPENIERYFNGIGSTRPEELRESRRRQLQTEKDRVVAQLEQLAASRGRLEKAITSSQAQAYQQSALGAATLQRYQNRAQLLTVTRVLGGIVALFAVLGGLALSLLIRRRRNTWYRG